MVAINNISEASRIVIKVGSSLVTSKDGNINEGFLDIIAFNFNIIIKIKK